MVDIIIYFVEMLQHEINLCVFYFLFCEDYFIRLPSLRILGELFLQQNVRKNYNREEGYKNYVNAEKQRPKKKREHIFCLFLFLYSP